MKVAEFRKVQAYVSLEQDDAVLLADYFEELRTHGQVTLYSHIAHGANISSWTQRMKLKREGWKMGVPDYIAIIGNTVLFIELKRTKGGTLSPEQKEWITNLRDKKTKAFVAKGFFDAKEYIDAIVNKEYGN